MSEDVRIVVITQEPSELLEALLNTGGVLGIVQAPLKRTKLDGAVRNVVRKVVQCIKKRSGLREVAQKHDISYFYMGNGCDKSLEQWMSNLNPDIAIVYSMSELLKKNIFSIPKYGTINLHPALLPKYRGPNPIFWMYYFMDLNPGITVHFVDSGEDTGAIIYQKSIQIPLGMKQHELYRKLIIEVGQELLLKTVMDIKTCGKIVSYPQPKEKEQCRARRLLPDEEKRIVQWDSWPIERVWHFLRGTAEGVAVLDKPRGIKSGQRWEILECEKCNTEEYSVGKIYNEEGRSFVACKGGKIYVKINFSIKRLLFFMLGWKT